MSENKQNGEKQPSKKNGPNPILLGITIVAVLGLVWFFMNSNTSPKVSKTGEAPASKKSSPKRASSAQNRVLKNLGRTIAVGLSDADLKNIVPEETSMVKIESIPGLSDALENSDVDVVVNLLAKNKITSVVVNPAITKRNPLPKNTVKNRLALAHPAGRLSAKLMTQKYFIYQLGRRAPNISKEAKQALIDVVRTVASGEAEIEQDSLPSVLSHAGDWRMILTVRPVQDRHLSFHSAPGGSLLDAAKKLGKKLANYYSSRDHFVQKYGPLPAALDSKINLELEIMYDKGVFVGPRERLFMWRIVEPGIYGLRVNIDGSLHHLPPWYTVTNNYRTVAYMMEKLVHSMGKKPKDYWLRDDVPIERFRTVHWREQKPGGDIEDLYRALPYPPAPKEITKESMLKSLSGLADWLADNQTQYKDGRNIYRYFPTSDTENKEYNIVRHVLGTFSLALTQEFAPKDNYKAAADESMRWIEERLRWGGKPRKSNGDLDEKAEKWMNKSLPGPDVAFFEADENMYDPSKAPDWSCKMGGIALAILSYSQYAKAGWELSPEQKKNLDGLANFLLYMQKEDGSFNHYYVAQENRYYNTRNSIYPGEILYAVARLYGDTKDERFKVAFNQSMKTNLEWFKREMEQKEPDGTYSEERRKNLVQFQPWIAMAMEEMHRYDPNPAYVEASNLVSLWVLETYQFDETRAFYPDYLGGYLKVLDELPAMHTFVYTEGTAASYMLARRANADKEAIEKLRKGALLSARFIIQQQARPGINDYYYPNPQKAKGAVRYCMNHNKQRIDYTYHALSSVYRILHAATPEDYAFIQSIKLPKAY